MEKRGRHKGALFTPLREDAYAVRTVRAYFCVRVRAKINSQIFSVHVLNQVFVNILVNASQAIEKEGEIRIATQQVNGYVEISIGDNGCGISTENITRVFDPFFTTKEIGKGTGLGMNIAYNIIKEHNGTIEVQSDVGKETIFTIKLPAEM